MALSKKGQNVSVFQISSTKFYLTPLYLTILFCKMVIEVETAPSGCSESERNSCVTPLKVPGRWWMLNNYHYHYHHRYPYCAALSTEYWVLPGTLLSFICSSWIFFIALIIPLYEHYLLVHSPIDGHVSSLEGCGGAIFNKAAVKHFVLVLCGTYAPISFGYLTLEWNP